MQQEYGNDKILGKQGEREVLHILNVRDGKKFKVIRINKQREQYEKHSNWTTMKNHQETEKYEHGEV